MASQIDTELTDLSGWITVDDSFQFNGWSVEFCELGVEARRSLLAAYRKSILPAEEPEIEELRALGIPIETLLFQEENNGEQMHRTTRADITEILAAASLIAREHVGLAVLVLANLPKKSRKQSEPGIDVMGVIPDIHQERREFGEGDEVVICSVKHTEKENMAQLRWNLEKSVDEMLDQRYLARQLRVLHGELRYRGIHAWRIMELLGEEHTSGRGRLKIVGVATADVTHRSALLNQMGRLGECSPASRICRNILVAELPSIHESV